MALDEFEYSFLTKILDCVWSAELDLLLCFSGGSEACGLVTENEGFYKRVCCVKQKLIVLLQM